jgi:hypothetical protein
MARKTGKPPGRTKRQAPAPGTRRYQSRGVEVEIRESSLGLRGSRAADRRVELTLDGVPIDIVMVDGQYHSQLANQFAAFDSIDEVVDTLLANEGRTWTLHGHFCDERCGPGGHHHAAGGHVHGHGPGPGPGGAHDHESAQPRGRARPRPGRRAPGGPRGSGR